MKCGTSGILRLVDRSKMKSMIFQNRLVDWNRRIATALTLTYTHNRRHSFSKQIVHGCALQSFILVQCLHYFSPEVMTNKAALFLLGVWTFILMAPIYCRGSIGEMQCWISPNLFWWLNKLIYILDDLRVSTFSANFHFWKYYSFYAYWKWFSVNFSHFNKQCQIYFSYLYERKMFERMLFSCCMHYISAFVFINPDLFLNFVKSILPYIFSVSIIISTLSNTVQWIAQLLLS